MRYSEAELRKAADELERFFADEKSGQGPCLPFDRAEVRDTLETAVCAGDLDSSVLSEYVSNPLWCLAGIPEDVRKSYDLPEVDRDSDQFIDCCPLPMWKKRELKKALSERQQHESLQKARSCPETALDAFERNNFWLPPMMRIQKRKEIQERMAGAVQKSEARGGALSHAEIGYRIEKSVREGKLPADIFSAFVNGGAAWALSNIPPSLREQCGLPVDEERAAGG